MNIKPGLYKNIKDLYDKNPDFKVAFDDDKLRSGSSPCEDYMDDYSDREGIVDGVLSDVIGCDTNYKWKISRHREWRDKTITIYIK